MKKLLFLTCFLAWNLVSWGQGVSTRNYLLLIPAYDSTSYAIQLAGGTVPIALYTEDTLTNTVARFEVHFGPTNSGMWHRVMGPGDTNYVVPIGDSTLVPLNREVTNGLIGHFTSETPQVWFRIQLGIKRSYNRILYLIGRYL